MTNPELIQELEKLAQDFSDAAGMDAQGAADPDESEEGQAAYRANMHENAERSKLIRQAIAALQGGEGGGEPAAKSVILDALQAGRDNRWTDEQIADQIIWAREWAEFEKAVMTAAPPSPDRQPDCRGCSCHPDERPEPCQRRYALSECLAAADTVEKVARIIRENVDFMAVHEGDDQRIGGFEDAARAILSALPREAGWLIEPGPGTAERAPGHGFLTMLGHERWYFDPDPNKAIRFSRRQDAEMFAAYMIPGAAAVEHQWIPAQTKGGERG